MGRRVVMPHVPQLGQVWTPVKAPAIRLARGLNAWVIEHITDSPADAVVHLQCPENTSPAAAGLYRLTIPMDALLMQWQPTVARGQSWRDSKGNRLRIVAVDEGGKQCTVSVKAKRAPHDPIAIRLRTSTVLRYYALQGA